MSDDARLEAAKRLTDPFFHKSLKLGHNWKYYVNNNRIAEYFPARNNLRSGITRPGVNYTGIQDPDFNPTNTIKMYTFEDFKIGTLFTFFIDYETYSPDLYQRVIRKKSNKIFAKLTGVDKIDHETMIIKYRLLGPGVTARPVSQKLLALYNKLNKEEYTMVLRKPFKTYLVEGVSGDQIEIFKAEIKSTEPSDVGNFKAVRFYEIEKDSLSGGASKTRRNRKGKAKKATRRRR
jgi:hypothetical protein